MEVNLQILVMHKKCPCTCNYSDSLCVTEHYPGPVKFTFFGWLLHDLFWKTFVQFFVCNHKHVRWYWMCLPSSFPLPSLYGRHMQANPEPPKKNNDKSKKISRKPLAAKNKWRRNKRMENQHLFSSQIHCMCLLCSFFC